MIERWILKKIMTEVINYGPGTTGYYFPEIDALKIYKIGEETADYQVTFNDVNHATHLASYRNKDTVAINGVYAFQKNDVTIVVKIKETESMITITPHFV